MTSLLFRPELYVLGLFFLAVLPLPMRGQEPEEIDIPYEKFVLDNGLTLIVHEDHKAPIVSVNVWYHVGSKNEKPGKTGFAHLFEHLMFNGSENYNDDWFQAMEKIGATDLNGTTNSDRTNYFQNVPSTAVDVALWMESDRMGHLLGAIDQAKLDEQRGVVQNEKRQGENQPYGSARELTTKGTYPAGHGYSWTTIGEMADLDAASLDDVKEWFQTYYGAANATLVIAGDITPEVAKAKVEKFFGWIPSGPPVARMRKWIAKRDEDKRETVEDRVPQARIQKIWNTPGWGEQETTHLDLLTDVLALGKTSRLYKRLVYEEQLATDVSASIYPREIAGQVTISALAQPGGDLAAIERAIDEELAKLLAEGPTERELERIKTQHRARFIRGIERIGGFGGKSDILAQNEVFSGDPAHYKIALEWARTASAKDLQNAGRKWLTTGAYILETHPLPEQKTAPQDVDRSKLPEVSEFPQLDLPDLQRSTLSNGLKVVLAERHDIPTVEIVYIADAGYAADQFARPGTAKLAMAMMDEGTDTRSALEISEEMALLGGSVSTSGGLDACYVSLSALTENLDASLDVWADILLNPSFPENELARLRRQQLATIGQEKSNPVYIAYRLLPGKIFGDDHAYGGALTGTGTEASVKAITREDLEKYHATWIQPTNGILAVTGDVTMAELLPKLEARLKNWKTTEAPPAKTLAEVPYPEERQVYFVDRPEAQQTLLIAGLPAPPTNNPNEAAIEAMNTVLGGAFTSRLNMNLREDKHWAYGARTMLFDAKGQRTFLAYAPVQADKTKEAMVEIDKELREILKDRPPTAEEIAKAKDNLTLRLPGQFETKSALLSAVREIMLYGLPEDHYETYADRVRALESTDLTAAAERVVRPDRMIWIVVGDASKVLDGVKELGFGEVKRMSPDGEVLP